MLINEANPCPSGCFWDLQSPQEALRAAEEANECLKTQLNAAEASEAVSTLELNKANAWILTLSQQLAAAHVENNASSKQHESEVARLSQQLRAAEAAAVSAQQAGRDSSQQLMQQLVAAQAAGNSAHQTAAEANCTLQAELMTVEAFRVINGDSADPGTKPY